MSPQSLKRRLSISNTSNLWRATNSPPEGTPPPQKNANMLFPDFTKEIQQCRNTAQGKKRQYFRFLAIFIKIIPYL